MRNFLQTTMESTPAHQEPNPGNQAPSPGNYGTKSREPGVQVTRNLLQPQPCNEVQTTIEPSPGNQKPVQATRNLHQATIEPNPGNQ